MRLRLLAVSWFVALSAAAGDGTWSKGNPGPASPAPVPARPLLLTTRAQVLPNDQLHLTSTLLNRSSTAQRLWLPDRCPSGPLDYLGLPETYDVYGTCASGACPGQRRPKPVVLAPGKSLEVGAVVLNLRGAQCAPPLTSGTYTIRAAIPETPDALIESVPVTFTVSLHVEVQSPPEPPPYVPPPPPGRPAPRSPPAGDISACTDRGDCVISCPTAPGCCGNPCGCRRAINRAFLEQDRAEFAKSCQRPPCPAMGCAYQPAFGASCVNGRCVAGESPGF